MVCWHQIRLLQQTEKGSTEIERKENWKNFIDEENFYRI
jgi:hypothetical protein